MNPGLTPESGSGGAQKETLIRSGPVLTPLTDPVRVRRGRHAARLRQRQPSGAAMGSSLRRGAMERGVVLSTSRTISPDLLPTQLTGSTYSASLLDHQPNASLFDLMEEIERRIISDRLERCHWNQTEAAEYFKIPLSTLNQKIKRLTSK